jgi:uncharacterized protein (TIGR03067 family)
MKGFIAASVAVVTATAVWSFVAAAQGRAGLTELVGNWREVSRVRDGASVPSAALGRMKQESDGKTATMLGGRVVYEGLASVWPESSPKEIDYLQTSDGDGKGQVRRGIYEVTGNTMRICLARPRADRPKAFSSEPGSGVVMSVYERERD